MAKKKSASDFRYATGAARVPWAAVGEAVNIPDIMAAIRFLLPANEGQEAGYERRLAGVEAQLTRLADVAHPATKLTMGGQVGKLEEAVRKFLKVKHAVMLTNATAGFEIAARMAGVGPGDEVIVPAITFIATVAYPLSVGAKVVFGDLDPRTINMDPADVAKKITRRTRMIIPVHIGGFPVDMDPLMKIARAKRICVLEDAAHAFGGTYKGKHLGTIGNFGSFSMHEVKNVTSFGEGGVLVSNTRYGKQFALARFCGVDPSRKIKNWLYDCVAVKGMRGAFAAGNHSVTEIQAVGLLNQMKRIRSILAERRRAARYLNRRLARVEGVLGTPMGTGTTRGTHHLFLLQIDPEVVGADIQALKAKLGERGVVQIPHFAPLYKFSVLRELGYDGEAIAATCPVAEEAFNHRFTHLPLYGLTQEQLDYMADAVTESVGELRAGR